MELHKFLPHTNAILYDNRLDFDPYSVNNILNSFPNMDINMAEAVSQASYRQSLRSCIKKDLNDYFFDLYINDDDKP